MEGEFISSERGNPLLLFKNYKYSKAHVFQCGKTRWRCVLKGCSAKVYTEDCNAVRIIEGDFNHSHQQDPHLGRHIIRNAVKRKAAEDICQKPAKLIYSEIRANSVHSSELSSEDVNCIRKGIYASRRKVLPALPKSVEEVFECLKQIHLTTNKEEPFLLAEDVELKIIVFSTFTNLHFLCSADVVYMDGTFNYCAKYFTQMFTLHGFKNGYYIPLVFALLPNKNTETYSNLFKIIIEKCTKFNLVFQPKEIVIDFEKAIHLSCKIAWPESIIVGCRFHLAQAWFRKIQALGLVTLYRDASSPIGQYLRCLFGIQFLNCSDVENFFNSELYYLMPNDERIITLRKYLFENYISNKSLFPPKIWAAHSDDLYRSTNCCESFHSMFNKNFYVTHPSIVTLCSTLLDVQIDVYCKIRSANNGRKIQRSQTRKRQLFLSKKILELKSNKITRYSFVKEVGYNYLPN